jgi:hypothetical protein
LPTRSYPDAGEKRRLGRIPVASHETFQIVTVPGVLLMLKDALHRGCCL